MVNADCSTPTGGLCQCSTGYYRQDDKCLPLKPPEEPCALDSQCVQNAACVMGTVRAVSGFW